MIVISVETANFIKGQAHSAFVSTRSIEDLENAFLCYRGATCTLTKSLKYGTLRKSKVVENLTAHGATLMSIKHICCKTYCVCYSDWLGEIRPVIHKAYVVPGWKCDLQWVRDFAGYSDTHHPDPKQSGIYAVINNKIDKFKLFLFLSEHSNLFFWN